MDTADAAIWQANEPEQKRERQRPQRFSPQQPKSRGSNSIVFIEPRARQMQQEW